MRISGAAGKKHRHSGSDEREKNFVFHIVWLIGKK
jgi:hypothetical protein